MTEPTNTATSPDRDALRLRHVLTILLVGAALGVGFNAMSLAADPSRALPWVKTQRRVVTLERIAHTPPVALAAETAPAATASSASTPPAAAATRDTARSTHGKAPAKGAKGATPAPAATATPAAASTPAPAATAAAVPASDLPVIPDSRDPVEVGVDVAKKFHAAGAALFLDARSAEEYAEGHVAGAINLPFDDVFKNPALAKAVDAKGRVLITYCGGGECDLSRSLAFSLIDNGFRKVLVFTGGIPAWTQAGLAVHKGAQP